ncbi:cysteine desulfurase family protein [Labrys monachus]|uniref:Cysteine desulfurase n=1 Tax=Labrys monachus TaxID=217067 RepID=A0ABU0FGR7_9HYPH|nr:cysteine desulfurase family protein [Labrys monachus]MDQ0393804.1 cysteine desulfurase [Labrys monachus]
MATARTYLDHNATTPMRSEARAAMLTALERCGAPSSIHGDGRAMRKLVETARHDVAALVGAPARNVVFCSSATEANNLALCLDWQRGRAAPLGRAAVSAVEHASVLSGGRIPADRLALLPVDARGMVDLAGASALLERWRAEGIAGLVSVMLANNETGVLQPVAALAERVHAAGGILHCDAAQAAGKIPLDIRDLGVDLITISSHKLGGPLGAGALVMASEALHLPNPLLRGGGQERGWRAGTENVPAIAGFGAAAAAAARDLTADAERCRALLAVLEEGVRAIAPEAVIFGEGAPRLPNTLCFAEPGIAAETALIALDLEGISVSSGSACSSGKVKVSHVLTAMGVPPDLAACALRVSLGRETLAEEVEFFVAVWTRLRKSLHDRKQHRAA